MAPLTVSSSRGRKWSPDEHERFLQALELYPRGSWKQRADHVRTRSTRQVMTHAQKLALKAKRHARGLQKAGRPACKNGASAGTPRRQNPRQAIRTSEAVAASPPLPLCEPPTSFVSLLEECPVAQVDVLSLYPVGERPEAPLSPVSPGTAAFSFGVDKNFLEGLERFMDVSV